MFAIKFVSDDLNGGYLADFFNWDEAPIRMEVALKDLMDRGFVVQETTDRYFYRIGRWVSGNLVKVGHVIITVKLNGENSDR